VEKSANHVDEESLLVVHHDQDRDNNGGHDKKRDRFHDPEYAVGGATRKLFFGASRLGCFYFSGRS
jgi:hypothetical protein